MVSIESNVDVLPNASNHDVSRRGYVKPEVRVLGSACEHTLGGPQGGGETAETSVLES
jgi:hypothetical protein